MEETVMQIVMQNIFVNMFKISCIQRMVFDRFHIQFLKERI